VALGEVEEVYLKATTRSGSDSELGEYFRSTTERLHQGAGVPDPGRGLSRPTRYRSDTPDRHYQLAGALQTLTYSGAQTV